MTLSVVHVDVSRGHRGGQQQLLALARSEPRPLAVIVPEDAPLRAALVANGVRVVTVPQSGRWRARRSLLGVIAELSPDVVAAHEPEGAAVCLSQRNVPVVVHRRVDFVPSWFGYRRLRRAAGVIAVSRAVAHVLALGGIARVRVVYDGVDGDRIASTPPDPLGVRAELGVPQDARLILSVGALVAHKGHRVMVEALASLPDIHGVVLGEGSLREALLGQAHSCGVASRLHLLGHRTDVARFLRSDVVFVHPSLEEGLGQAVIEASHAGIPIVTSDAGGLPELGLGVCVARDEPAKLADAIRRAFSDGTGAQCSTFSVARMVHETHQAYLDFFRNTENTGITET